MMTWKECGKYLDRVVRMIGLDTLESYYANTSLSSSMLLLCFETCKTSREDIRIFLAKVVPLDPLAIVVAGKCASDYFDEILSYLDDKNGRLHIMTGVNETLSVDDWEIQFLQATWPVEERFDSWKEYEVIVIGDIKFQEKIYAKFKKPVD